jgi:hypothetical protein
MPEKPVLLICGCKKYEPYLHAAIQRFKHDSWTIIGIIGDSYEINYNINTNILSLPVEDTYEALPSKIHAAISWCNTMVPTIPGIFKTDDDIFIDDLELLKKAIFSNITCEYWGLYTEICASANFTIDRINSRFTNKQLRPTFQSAHYCYGHGYWIGKSAIAAIVSAKDEYIASYSEDVCTGYVLNKVNIYPIRIPVTYKEIHRTCINLE